MKKKFFVFLISFILIFSLFFFVSNFVKRKNEIIIGTKNHVENKLLANMISILIEENSDLKVSIKHLDGTFVCFQALLSSDIDLYVEFTATAYLAILKEKLQKNQNLYQIVKKEFLEKFDIVWLDAFGFYDNYVLLMLKERAENLGINKISDLEKYKNLKVGLDPEFITRDEFRLLKENYSFQFKKHIKSLDNVLLYCSLLNKNLDVIDGYTTDSFILKYDLKLLEDDKKIFPNYRAAPIIRLDILKKYPNLENIINKLANKISIEEIQKMNYDIDCLNKSVKSVAITFLFENGLIENLKHPTKLFFILTNKGKRIAEKLKEIESIFDE